MAYQGYGNGLKLDVLEMLQESIFDKLNADLTIILDTLPNISLSRARKRKNGNQKYENISKILYENENNFCDLNFQN